MSNTINHYYKNTIHRSIHLLSKWLYSCMLDSPDQYLNKAIRRICLPSYWKKIYIIWLRLSHLTFWWEKCKQMICWNFYLIKITFNIHCSLFTRIKKKYILRLFFCSNELHEDLKKGLAEVSSLFITELQKITFQGNLLLNELKNIFIEMLFKKVPHISSMIWK